MATMAGREVVGLDSSSSSRPARWVRQGARRASRWTAKWAWTFVRPRSFDPGQADGRACQRPSTRAIGRSAATVEGPCQLQRDVAKFIAATGRRRTPEGEARRCPLRTTIRRQRPRAVRPIAGMTGFGVRRRDAALLDGAAVAPRATIRRPRDRSQALRLDQVAQGRRSASTPARSSMLTAIVVSGPLRCREVEDDLADSRWLLPCVHEGLLAGEERTTAPSYHDTCSRPALRGAVRPRQVPHGVLARIGQPGCRALPVVPLTRRSGCRRPGVSPLRNCAHQRASRCGRLWKAYGGRPPACAVSVSGLSGPCGSRDEPLFFVAFGRRPQLAGCWSC